METVEEEAKRRFPWAWPPESDKHPNRDWEPTWQKAREQVRDRRLGR